MKRKNIERIIAGVSVLTLGTTPPIMTMAEKNDIVIELEKQEIQQIEIKTTQIYNEFVEQTERIIAEKEEAERLRLEEEARIKAEEEIKRLAEINRKNSVSVNLDNVLEPSNMTTDELIAVFDFYEYSRPMKELAWIFIEAEQTYGINAFILSAIASWESSYNTSTRAIYDNNVLGWGVTSSSAVGVNASSKYENIMNAAEFLRAEYLTEGGLYCNGITTWGISRNYCRDEYGNPSESWRIGVNAIACEYLWVYNYLHK